MQHFSGKRKFFRRFFLPLSLLSAGCTAAQEVVVVSRLADYKAAAKTDSLHRMVNLKAVVPSALLDLRYATAENFTGRKLYRRAATTYLRLPAAKALQAVATELADSGYTLKIWDAYRPHAATRLMWELVHDERYVANPAKGSGHNRGLAVDLTLMKNGKEVEMGTGFDNFSDTAHHAFAALPAQTLAARQLLRRTMEKHGFRALETEWWHYSWPNDRAYAVLDLSFRQLGRQR